MKILFPLIIMTLLTELSFAQSANYIKAIENFEKNYNSGNFEKIFDDFSPEMQKALPLENTKQFLKDLNSQAGKIESKEFINFQKKTYASYKTKFEKGILSVDISLDNQNKINGLFIKPFTEEKESNTVNSLKSVPNDISETIFNQVKDFPNKTQLSIAIIENGKTTFYGILKENDSIKSVNNQNKVFEIGSITKVFTSTVLASLVEEGKIKLSDNINKFYGFPFKDDIKITFESLANHTSGLPRLPENFDLSNETNPYKNYDAKKLDEYLKNEIKLENQPGKVYSYSNLGGGLLGYTLGLSQKTTFQELLQKRVFDKYKMNNSYTSSQNLNEKLIKGLDNNGNVVPNWDFDALFGGGGILSTTEDLAKFANAQFNSSNLELSLTRKPTFTINEKMKIGLGWHIIKTEHGKELYWHNGGTGGYSSSIALDLDTKKGIIILSNVSAFNPNMKNIDNLDFELMSKIEKQ